MIRSKVTGTTQGRSIEVAARAVRPSPDLQIILQSRTGQGNAGTCQVAAVLMSDQRPFAITNLSSPDKIGILFQIGALRVESFFSVISPGILVNVIALIVYAFNGIMRFHIHRMEPAEQGRSDSSPA